tara:strand:+ start:7205 stop:8548 length:1344 start_codon:yes stop_codon:yes gene_type:complete
MISIEQQIRSGLIISLLVVMSLLAVLADYAVTKLSQDFVTTRLQHDTDNLINALSLSSEGTWQLDPQRLTPVYQRVRSGHYFQVLSASQTLRSRSLWDRVPAVDFIAVGQTRQRQQFVAEEHWLVWQQGVELQGQPVTLWVVEDIAPFELQWRYFSIIMYAVMLMVVILLVLLQRYLLKRGFSQISAIQEAIRQLQQGEIEALTTQVPREIQPLTQEINYLLKRLEQRITRSRCAMGNLAHELKLYLQHLHLLRDTLPDKSKPEYDQALLQISQLTERELKRARIAGTPHPGRRFCPTQDLPHMIRLLERIYPQVKLQLVLETPAMPNELPYDRDDMLELIGNLLDNGCKFGATKVRLRLSLTPTVLRIVIEDDGTGVSTQLCQQLTERGTRIDESVAGHGLGLSICQMISDSYLGEMYFSSDPETGLFQVKVKLPFNAEIRESISG